MERQLVHPKKPYQPDVVRPVVLGGTNAVTALDAVINLGGISETQVGQALGIAATGSGANLVSGQPSDNRGLVYIYE